MRKLQILQTTPVLQHQRHKLSPQKKRYPSPMNATVTQSDPKTVNYEDVFRTARRKCLLWPLVPRCCFLLWMSSVSCKDTYLPMHTFSSKTKKNLYNLSLYHNKYSSLHYDDNLLLPKI